MLSDNYLQLRKPNQISYLHNAPTIAMKQKVETKREHMGKVVTQYTNGEINSFKFKQELTANDIQIDPQMDSYIKKHDGGDFLSHSVLGRKIFSAIDKSRPETYTSPTRTKADVVKRPFLHGYPKLLVDEEKKQGIIKEDQNRYVGNTYLQKKGGVMRTQTNASKGVGELLELDRSQTHIIKKKEDPQQISSGIIHIEGIKAPEGADKDFFGAGGKKADPSKHGNNGNILQWSTN